jgi:hypothetical protein
MPPIKARKMGNIGQSTIEFALVLIFLMSIIFFFLQMCFVFAYGNYVHYATFMAARAYLSAGPSIDDQEARATAVITKMLKRSGGFGERFPSIAQGVASQDEATPPGLSVKPPPQFVDGDRNFSWLQGVRYTFKSRLFLLPFGTSQGGSNSTNSVTFSSESWLLRDPSTADCVNYMGTVTKGFYDNGC